MHSISNAKGEKRCDVEKAFIDWVDALGGARGSEGEDDEDLVEQQAQEVLRAVRGLLEQLIRVGVVSYALYLQRMIARGDTVERGGAVSYLFLLPPDSAFLLTSTHNATVPVIPSSAAENGPVV